MEDENPDVFLSDVLLHEAERLLMEEQYESWEEGGFSKEGIEEAVNSEAAYAEIDNIKHMFTAKENIFTDNQFVENSDLVLNKFANQSFRILNKMFSVEFLKKVNFCVKRSMKLAGLFAKEPASKQTNLYIHEATSAYILGLPIASVVLSRAALEQALKDRLGLQNNQQDIRSLAELIENANTWKLFEDSTSTSAAIEMKKQCNKVIHEGPIDESEAFQIISIVRDLIREIFASNPRP